MYLTKNYSPEGSVLVLGGVDMKYAATEFKYYPVMGTYVNWMLALDSFKIGNTKV